MQIQLCVVSQQPLANLLPVLEQQPEQLYLLTSARMGEKAQRLTEVLTKTGTLTREQIHQVPLADHDVACIIDQAVTLLADLQEQHPTAQLHVNLTGGNKLMSLALYQAASAAGCAAFYLDTDHEQTEWLLPTPERQALPANLLNISFCLKAHGFTQRKTVSDQAHWQDRAQERRAATLYLAQHAAALDWLLSNLNKSLNTTKDRFKNSVQQAGNEKITLHDKVNRAGQQALQQLEADGIISQLEVAHGVAPSFYLGHKDALDYLTGQWLEEFTWLTLHDAGINELAGGLDLTDDIASKLNIRNEMDAVAVHRNRLLAIECKTAHLADETTYNNVLSKLDTLRSRSGGNFAQCWLVLARMPQSGRDAAEREQSQARMRERARSMGVVLIEPADLGHFNRLVKDWMTTLQPPKSRGAV